MLNENENIEKRHVDFNFFSENEERTIDDLDIMVQDGQIILYKGLDQYVLENDLASTLGMISGAHLRSLYRKAEKDGKFNPNEDRIILNQNQNKYLKNQLQMSFQGKRLTAVKYTVALDVVRNSGSSLAPIAEKELYNFAVIGVRALRLREMKKQNHLGITSEEFMKTLNFLSEDKELYPLTLKELKKKGSEGDELSKNGEVALKSYKAINDNHVLNLTVEQAKFVKGKAKEEIDYIFKIKQQVLEGKI